MKFFLYLYIILILSSCALKQKNECISSSLLINKDDKNINILLQDNGCKYSINKMPENIWKIEVLNGYFSQFTPRAEKEVKSQLPVIKKNDKEILLFFTSNGNLIQNKSNNSFTFIQKNLLGIPERKAGYIESILCSNDKTIIKSNGAVIFNTNFLYNGKKYIDIYNISLKKDYFYDNKCNMVSSPLLLRFPKRVRYFLNSNELNVANDGESIIISNKNSINKQYLTDVYEEKTLKTQKIKLEFSNNIEITASNITPNYTTIILNGKYELLKNIQNITLLKGLFFKQIQVTTKSEITEIKLYNRTIKEPFISIDKVDNNIIIYANK